MVTADPALRSPLLDTPDEESGLDALTLGRRIRDLRTARRMTLDSLAAAIERAPSQVSMIENGKREPRLSMLRTIAAALGTSVDDLLQATPPSPPSGAPSSPPSGCPRSASARARATKRCKLCSACTMRSSG
jgi:DNA-binding XRE family transcriptional regulator